MHTEFLMGNEAMALGALAAGVQVCAGYPGTPSTEVMETVARRRGESTYVEWSVNEKAALEVAAGAAISGARALVTCKQVGLNVASDPLMSLAYIGVKAALVILVADDPGPISSQTEQDTRTFAQFAKVAVFDPAGVAEAYQMMQDAFELSEREHMPVIVRATTRVDHGYEAIEVKDPEEWVHHVAEGFVKDSSKWVIFPRLSFAAHNAIETRDERLAQEFSSQAYARYNCLTKATEERDGDRRLGIACGGISSCYVTDALAGRKDMAVLKIGTPHPFPEALAAAFLRDLDEVLCIEELDPVIERALLKVAGMCHITVLIKGKLTGDAPHAGELTVDVVREMISAFDVIDPEPKAARTEPPTLAVRPPVLCAGCPHRASFYAVKQAMRGKKTAFCGDIGCYTLGNAQPLDMVDTCLCMGAGITMAQGIWHTEPDRVVFSFVGDSTFFASGITGVVNAVYNQVDLTVVVLDNATTAMTGHQCHPGTGRTLQGQTVAKVDIAALLAGVGVEVVETVDPLDHKLAIDTVRRVSALPGVKAIIFRSPCVVLAKPTAKSTVDASACVSCRRCIRETGCPALMWQGGKAVIDQSQCTGCTLCEQVCPVGAISGGERL